MLNRVLLLLSFLCISTAMAAQVTLSGLVSITDEVGTMVPIPGYEVIITEAGSDIPISIVTDDLGVYTYSTDVADGDTLTVTVLDVCTFTLLSTVVPILDGVTEYENDFSICSDFDPPPPADTCLLFFDYLPFAGDPLTIAFTSSFTTDPATTELTWDFGDGGFSNEFSPLYTYAEGGDYDVTLTLTSDSCDLTVTQTVHVFDAGNCDCTDTLAPVCVYDIFGFVITFDNACLAECAGYSQSQFFDCDSDCFCPTFDAPVCVVNDAGDTLTFSNHCFAECEGFGPDTWFDCTPVPDCDCDDEPIEQVCVDVFGINLPFNNACEALCAGFTEDMFVECDTLNCGCPDFIEPVCVIDTITGDTTTYDNFCLAGCAGVDYNDLFDCSHDPGGCVCPDIYDPVCVITDFGDTISFNNSCEAECAGFGLDLQFECGPNFCDFPDFPVCYTDPATGEEIQFANLCDAIAAGIPTDSIYPCFVQPECFAAFDFLIDPNDSLTVEFFNQSSTTDTLVSLLWEFGDGNISTEENPIYTYAEEGVYVVTLTITDASGCTSVSTFDVLVGEPPAPSGCFAFFFFEQPDSSNFLTFQFVNFSDFGTDATYLWQFGDGNSSTEVNPLYTYAEEGNYQVSLTVITANGCESTVEIVVSAGENIWYGDLECRAWFMPIIIPEENYVTFLNLSSYDAVSFSWDFGDGAVSTERDIDHVYDEPGIYEVTLTIVSATGCENSYSATIDLSTGNFTSNPQFSLISSVETTIVPEISELTAAPNPTNGLLRLNWESPAVNDYAYQLFDLNGRALLQGKGQTTGNENILTLDLSPFAGGMYYLQVRSGNSLETVKIIKTE